MDRSGLIFFVFLTVLGLALGLLLKDAFSSQSEVMAEPVIIRADGPSSPLAFTVTVSGTVNGPGGPAEDVEVGVSSDLDWQDTTTDAGGFYSATLQTEGVLHFHLRPDPAARLAQANLWMDGVAADFTQNFTLTEGHLLDLQLTGSGGGPITDVLGLEVQPLANRLPDEQWYELDWNEGTQRYAAVLPPDVYYVTAHDPPDGYYRTSQPFDLRSADRSVTMTLGTSYVHPIPYEPPDATKITIGPPDDLGEAVVTGTAGAALGLARVLLVNLNSSHQAHTISEADGSFSARIYAPPGSAVMIKHGPASHRWNELEAGLAEGANPFPGTIINLPHTHTGGPHETSFAAAGSLHQVIDDVASTHNYVGAAWAMTGTVGPVVAEGSWTRVLTGTYDGETVPGLYLGGLNWTHPALGDLDGDGDLELLVGEQHGRLVLHRNTSPHRSRLPSEQVAQMMTEAAAPDWQFETADYAGVETDDWAYPALADVTNDGALDLFVGAGDGTVSIYYNDGTPSEAAWPTTPDVSLSTGPGAAPALDDLNGDGLLDLLVGHAGGEIYHFRNTGTVTDPVWSEQTSSYAAISEEGEGIQPAFVDLDGDADRDLLIGLCGQLVWYEREGTVTNPTWTRHADDPIGYGGGSCATSPGVGDWSGDGEPDLVIGEHWGNLRFFQGAGTLTPTLSLPGRGSAPPSLRGRGWGRVDGWTEQGFEFPFELAGDSAPALADWDDDGDLDLLIGQAHGQVHKYTNVGSASTPDWRPDGELLTLPWTDHPHPFPTFADIDGDSDYDLFIGEGGGLPDPDLGGNVRYYRNAGTPSSPTWTLVVTDFLGLDVGGWSTPAFADVDADSDEDKRHPYDLFIGSAAGSLTFVENTGTVTEPTWAAPVQPYADLDLGGYSAPTFLDLGEDTSTKPNGVGPLSASSDLDMLVGLEDGRLAYVRNSGTITEAEWELVTTAYQNIDVGERAIPAAADIDGDGDADLLIGDGDGGLNLYRYEGPGTPPEASDTYAPGDQLQIEGTLRLHSPAITATTDLGAIAVQSGMGLMMLYNQDGRPMAAENYFGSTMLTPGGFPIQRAEQSSVWMEGGIFIAELRFLGDHAIGGDFSLTTQLPDDLPAGVYRPTLWVEATGVPTSTDWLAANVTYHTFGPSQAPLPPIRVGQVASSSQRLIWRLLMDDIVQGVRGAGARSDRDLFALTSHIVSQGAPYYTPPSDVRTGSPITYRLEPFLPMISFTDRRLPTPPLLPFELPGGRLGVTIREPDGSLRDLGSESFAQSFNRTATTRGGGDLNSGTVQLDDVYSLKAASDRFRVTFDQYGHHVITMTGAVSDVWGNSYAGGGVYDVWVAEPLDIDPGVLPGTPLAVGDGFNPALQFYPRVPAEVRITLSLYPDSDPVQAITHTLTGRANRFGYFSPNLPTYQSTNLPTYQSTNLPTYQSTNLPTYQSTNLPITLTHPGEYRVDLSATYTDTDGVLYMGAMTWGGIVMTPDDEADLSAHGRRGVDSLEEIPNHWFVSCRDLSLQPEAVSHTLNPYFNGDVIWSRMVDGPDECPAGVASGGDSLVLGASVQDTVGTIQSAIEDRVERMGPALATPGDFDERVAAGELPLFISTRSGLPPQFALGKIGASLPEDVDQIAYSYRSSQRPGVRVRELVAEDGQSGSYWRLDTLYDDQLGVGVLGDQPNDFKFQYVGAVYRDLESGHSEYVGQGSGWIFIPDEDETGTRVMPPFAGPGNGGWTTEGGPLLTLKGEDVHIFILPTGVRPGAVLHVGDTFRFAGHVMPTLDSHVAVTVTAPSGTPYTVTGQANRVGYFYDPADDFVVNEPGLWSVDVHVWHAGQIGTGDKVLCATDPSYPCPSGDVLGSDEGRYWFYVAPRSSPRLDVSSPVSGMLSFEWEVTPITISGALPTGLTGAVLDYTISMPGYILEQGQATIDGERYQIVFDPLELSEDFPNLDLVGRDDHEAGLSDTFAIGLLLRGESAAARAGLLAPSQTVYRANTITIQGERVYIGEAPAAEGEGAYAVYLPLIMRQRFARSSRVCNPAN